MADVVDIVVNSTIDNVNVTPSIISEIVDIDVSATKTSIEITATPYLTIVNINEVSVINTEEGIVIPTNLYYDAYPTYGVVNSNTGADATIPLANSTNAGLLSPSEKTKINNSALTTYVDSQDALKVDKVTGSRLITSAEATKLANTSGVNTGDQNLSSYATTTYVNTQDNLKEPNLGNPDDDGYILASDANGDRYWIVPPTGGGASTFQNNIIVSLSPNKTLGKYINGQTIFSAGLTFEEVMNDIAVEYLFPSITSFTISGQPTTVESGTLLTGVKSFTFSTSNSGNISEDTLSIYQQSIPIGSEFPVLSPVSVTVSTINLTGNGTSYNWYATAINTQSDTFQSNTYSITSRYKQFYGNVTTTTPTTSAEIRALSNNNFANVNSWVTSTITTTKFALSIPATKSLTTVITANFENITSSFIAGLSTFNVNDAGGNAIPYKTYIYTSTIPLNLTVTITVA